MSTLASACRRWCWLNLSRSRSSRRHGTHHVAKKFTATHRPRKASSRMASPDVTDGPATSGAGRPSSGLSASLSRADLRVARTPMNESATTPTAIAVHRAVRLLRRPDGGSRSITSLTGPPPSSLGRCTDLAHGSCAPPLHFGARSPLRPSSALSVPDREGLGVGGEAAELPTQRAFREPAVREGPAVEQE